MHISNDEMEFTCMRSENLTTPHPILLTSGSTRINCIGSITKNLLSFL